MNRAILCIRRLLNATAANIRVALLALSASATLTIE